MNSEINLKDPKWDSLKAIFFIGIVVVAGMFAVSKSSLRDAILPGMVDPLNSVGMSVDIYSVPGTQKVEKDIYGVALAKYWDEIGPWGDNDIENALEELDLNSIRNVGGLVKYQRVWLSDEQVAELLTEDEQMALLPGNEVRGFGYIIADRISEEAAGNEGEVAEITEPKPKYDNLSYLEGYQNSYPHNFIHDIVSIANVSDATVSYTININYGTPEEAAQQVAFLIDQGVNLKYVEMGNEVYSKGNKYYINGNPLITAPISVASYIEDANEFRSAIAAVAPNVKFALVAAPKKGFEEAAEGFDSDGDFNTQWNIALNEAMNANGYDTYIMHFYHGFFTCSDIFTSMQRDDIFNCSKGELDDFDNPSPLPNLATAMPPIYDYYHDTFSDKNMIITEWNINQDSTRTNSTLANSILHAAFTGQFLNLINDANFRHGNFIKLASYHTFATDGGNAMISKRTTSNNEALTEPEDIGNFVRRTPYFAMKSMKNIFKNDYTPAQYNVNFTEDAEEFGQDIFFYTYKSPSGNIAIFVSNLSNKTLRFSEISLDGQNVDLYNSASYIEYIDGNNNYYSLGTTEFEKNPGLDANVVEERFKRTSNLYIPAYGVGTVYITPKYAQEASSDNPSPDNNQIYTSEIITYATTNAGTNLMFEFSKPEDAQNPLPVVVALHGGAFGPGGLNVLDGYISDFTGAGYATVEASYRSLSEGTFPAQVQDIKGLIRYLRANSATLGIDPNKIAVLGTSSGGMIMNTVGFSADEPSLEGTTGGNTGFSSRPNAIINLFGSVDPANPFNLKESIVTIFKEYAGCESNDPCTGINIAVAANYADAGDPPILTLHGEEDDSVYIENSYAIHQIFNEQNIQNALITLPGVGHDKEAVLDQEMEAIIDFLDTTLYESDSFDFDDYQIEFSENDEYEILGPGLDNWTMCINGNEKHNKYNSLYEGAPLPITLKVHSYPEGEVVYQVNDLTNHNTILNNHLIHGQEYTLQFIGVDGQDMETNWEVSTVLTIINTPPPPSCGPGDDDAGFIPSSDIIDEDTGGDNNQCGFIANIIGVCKTDTKIDTTDPKVSITSPLNGSIVSGNVNIVVSVQDNINVRKVYWYLDDKQMDGVEVNSKYQNISFNLNANNLSAGAHSIYALVEDSSGNTSTSKTIRIKTN
ncbi:alpha/beta hydrolase fold domain-containing protein [Candidatus Nomurabacteria bacterium]|nr:alpha/beta hydrolase fold domain-containing protein [Candidatus Nomurabacteria bacterium]